MSKPCHYFSKDFNKLNPKFRKGWNACPNKHCDIKKSHFCDSCFTLANSIQRHPNSSCPLHHIRDIKSSNLSVVGNSNAVRFITRMNNKFNFDLSYNWAVNSAELFKTKKNKPSIRDLLTDCIKQSKARIVIVFQPALVDLSNNIDTDEFNATTFIEEYSNWYRQTLTLANSMKKVIIFINTSVSIATDYNSFSQIGQFITRNNQNIHKINNMLSALSEKICWHQKKCQ